MDAWWEGGVEECIGGQRIKEWMLLEGSTARVSDKFLVGYEWMEELLHNRETEEKKVE